MASISALADLHFDLTLNREFLNLLRKHSNIVLDPQGVATDLDTASRADLRFRIEQVMTDNKSRDTKLKAKASLDRPA